MKSSDETRWKSVPNAIACLRDDTGFVKRAYKTSATFRGKCFWEPSGQTGVREGKGDHSAMEQRLDYYSLVGFSSDTQSPDNLERLSISAKEIALFIDFDGTFVDIAPTPDAITVSQQDVELLELLGERHSGAISIVSGRNLADIDHHLGGFSGTASGGHGAELRRGGKRSPMITCDTEQLDHIRNAVREFSAIDPRIVVEEKKFGIVMHYRQFPELETKIRDFATSLLSDDCRFETLSAKMAIEIKSKDVSKAKAIERIMNFDEFRGRTALFAGDDETDEGAFSWVNDHGGITIKIGEGLTLAKYRVDSPAAFKNWLRAQLSFADQGSS
ncbi:trehalose-phosphatase [Hoeflea sp. YIM 152468]|uniref:trehalose-phosphatase n=1 Tax=Hoeflea sp. YIM 152468 TaxID=3031759 RepID=UPI0023DB0EAC|nr:trehalose-phosphatase [Hoeflea sp. YIM 152468]MDF1609393.1 trehalose-phosphatase [Hoeflea sp. YIM 152468]